MIRICFLIRQLNEGGAQRQLLALVKGMDKTKFNITLMSFYDGGCFSEEAKHFTHVKYICLKKSGRWDVFNFIYRLIRQLRQINPDVLHGYLGLANCLTIFMKPFLPKARMIFGVRASNVDLSHYDWLNRYSYKLECFLSRFAHTIIVNSKAGYRHSALNGFPENKMVVIPNGIDTEKFKPDPEARTKLRGELGVKNGETLIGLIGRLDPMKGHTTFLEAASIYAKSKKNVRFACIGTGPEIYKEKLVNLANKLGLSNLLLWVDSRNDMPKIFNALDMVSSSSSFGEGFPNVIGEAMASSVPCVVTDVGDSSWIVGETGVVVPPNNPKALAEGLLKCLNLNKDNEEKPIQARLRIENHFSLNKMVERTESVLYPYRYD
jgi:glycosyltransferase involved in cell wall biosynthesis